MKRSICLSKKCSKTVFLTNIELGTQSDEILIPLHDTAGIIEVLSLYDTVIANDATQVAYPRMETVPIRIYCKI